MTRAKDMSDFGVSASAGAIVNVQQAVKLGTQNVTSTSYVLLTGLTIDITPKSSSSKFLIEYHINGNKSPWMRDECGLIVALTTSCAASSTVFKSACISCSRLTALATSKSRFNLL